MKSRDRINVLEGRVEELEAWKKDAIAILNDWDEVYVAAGKPYGVNGDSKPHNVRDFLNSLPHDVKLRCPYCKDVVDKIIDVPLDEQIFCNTCSRHISRVFWINL